jgi:hypothetical protein
MPVFLVLGWRAALADQSFDYRQERYRLAVPTGWHVATDQDALASEESLTLRTFTERAQVTPDGAAEIIIVVLPGTETPRDVTDRERADLAAHLEEKEAQSLKRRTTQIAGHTVEELDRDFWPALGASGPPEALDVVLKCTDAAMAVDGRIFVVHMIDHGYPGARAALETIITTLGGLT